MPASSWREPKSPGQDMRWVTCRTCEKRFFKAAAVGRVEILCPRCKDYQTQDLGARR